MVDGYKLLKELEMSTVGSLKGMGISGELRGALGQDDIKSVWQIICWRMNVHRVSPEKLAGHPAYSQDLIRRGIAGELVPIMPGFLPYCVRIFGLGEGRAEVLKGATGVLTDDVCIEILKPPSAMPPRQGNFWDYPSDE